MSKSKKAKQKIVIRGMSFDNDFFKLLEIDPYQLRDNLENLVELGQFARDGNKNIASLINNSPLIHIEGLIRFQLQKQNCEDHGIILENLQTPLDFVNDNKLVHGDYCPKVEYLFNFLSDIVWLSHYPESIDLGKLDNIWDKLLAFSFLVQPQLAGSQNSKSFGFDYFAFLALNEIEEGRGREIKELNISALQFWNKALSMFDDQKNKKAEIREHPDKIKFKFRHRLQGVKRIDSFEAQLKTNKKGDPVIRVTCESEDIPNGQAKGFSQVLNEWKTLEKKYIDYRKKLSE